MHIDKILATEPSLNLPGETDEFKSDLIVSFEKAVDAAFRPAPPSLPCWNGLQADAPGSMKAVPDLLSLPKPGRNGLQFLR